MSFSLCLGLYGLENFAGPQPDPRILIDVVRQAEAHGFDQVVVTDHVVMGERTDRYPYGPFMSPPDYQWYEPMTLLSVLAGATSRIGLSQGILISPLRSAVLLAKQAATLDVLSGGRLTLGVGTGWQREEYEASGVPFAGRKGRLFEQLDAMRTLWREAPASFAGEYYQFERIYSRPAPMRGTIPCWVGVKATPENCDAIARHADGWIPIEQDPAQYAEGVAALQQAFIAYGRDPSTLQVRAQVQPVMRADGAFDLEASLATIPQMLAAGVTHVEVLPIVFCRSLSEIEDFLAACQQARQRYSTEGL